jgi:predicted GNAT superfamily acetyltransferase
LTPMPAPNHGIVVRKCETLVEFQACVALQREIWNEADLEVVPATTFVVAAETGGQVLGAFAGERLVGYSLALAGLRNGAPFLHSHMTGVASDYRDRGVGRSLKLFQRDEALGAGIRLIEWTFDPLETRNGHFNLNRLGAISRRYLPNFYGVTSSPLHRGLATDRLVAEWYLDSPRVRAAISAQQFEPTETPAAIQVPKELEGWKKNDLSKVQTTQDWLRREFTDWFRRGYAAIGVRSKLEGSAYLLVPWSEF